MALTAEALTTLARVKSMLGIPQSENTDDIYLEDLINSASTAIQEHCGRKFVARNYNDGNGVHSTTGVTDENRVVFTGKGSLRHSLPQYPVSSVGFVLERLMDREDDTWEELTENVDYEIDREIGIITALNGCFSRGHRNYRVTMTAGYTVQSATPWIPYDLENACKVIVREAYKETEILQSEKIGDISRAYDVLNKHRKMVEAVLENYRADSNFM